MGIFKFFVGALFIFFMGGVSFSLSVNFVLFFISIDSILNILLSNIPIEETVSRKIDPMYIMARLTILFD